MNQESSAACIRIVENGPYIVTGGVPLWDYTVLSDRMATAVDYRPDREYPSPQTYSLCRCGKSKHMPYCDGTHAHVGFTGRERASRKSFAEQAVIYRGPGLILEDVEHLCMLARFCHLGGDTWTLIEKSDDPRSRELAIRGAVNCPAGRLVVRDARTGELIEPALKPSIWILRDDITGTSGPLWVRGGIPIVSSDGTTYEVRNRVTLCRCGRSTNMPFCDASHISFHFRD